MYTRERLRIYERRYENSPKGKASRQRRAQRQIIIRRKIIRDAKSAPCMDCKIQYNPCQMDFDHRPGTIKLFCVGSGLNGTIESLKAEIAKCEPVCANCHRNRTYKRAHL